VDRDRLGGRLLDTGGRQVEACLDELAATAERLFAA